MTYNDKASAQMASTVHDLRRCALDCAIRFRPNDPVDRVIGIAETFLEFLKPPMPIQLWDHIGEPTECEWPPQTADKGSP